MFKTKIESRPSERQLNLNIFGILWETFPQTLVNFLQFFFDFHQILVNISRYCDTLWKKFSIFLILGSFQKLTYGSLPLWETFLVWKWVALWLAAFLPKSTPGQKSLFPYKITSLEYILKTSLVVKASRFQFSILEHFCFFHPIRHLQPIRCCKSDVMPVL